MRHRLELELDFDGLRDGAAITLAGPASSYQKVEDAVYALAKKAAAAAGTLRLDVRFADPAAPDGPELAQLRKVVTDLSPGEVRLKGVLS